VRHYPCARQQTRSLCLPVLVLLGCLACRPGSQGASGSPRTTPQTDEEHPEADKHDDAVDPGFDDLSMQVALAEARAPNSHTAKALGRITEQLRLQWESAGRPSVPILYAETIRQMAHELEKALRSAKIDESILSSYTDDLGTKCDFTGCRRIGAPFDPAPWKPPERFLTRVRVTVHVTRGSHPVVGVQVLATPWVFRTNRTDPRVVFNGTTPPVTSVMAAGRYLLWIQGAGSKVLRELPVVIGMAGDPEEAIEIELDQVDG